MLYETASGLESMQSRNGFAHTIMLPAARTRQRAQLRVYPLMPQVRWINERQCRVECVLEMRVSLYERQEKTLITGVQGKNVESTSVQISGAWMTGSSRQIVTLKEEVELSAELPEAETILLCQGQAEIQSLSSQAGQVHADGILQLGVMYSTSKPDKVEKTVLPIRFSQQWDASELGQTQWLVGDGSLQDCRIRIYENIRGERRVLAAEAQLMLLVQGYAEQKADALVDAYSWSEEIDLERETWLIPGTPQQSQTAVAVSGLLRLPEGTALPERIVQVLVNPVIDEMQVEPDRVALSGRLLTHIIHVNTEGVLGCITANAPLEGMAAAPGLQPGAWLQLEAISAAPSAQVTPEGILVRDSLNTALTWRNVEEKIAVTEAESEPWEDELPKGLSLVVTQQQEDTWKVAKRCRVSMERLLMTNPQLQKRQAEPGECLVVERV